LVNAQELDQDYLANVTDIIPQRNSATTVLPDYRKRSEPLAYTVEAGDTLSGIGSKFKVSVDALRYVNGLRENALLSVGQAITIPPVSGLIHKVERGDTLRSIALKYDVPSQAIADFNYILDTSKLAVGVDLVIPGAKIPQQVIIAPSSSSLASGPSSDPGASKGWCQWPTTVRIITQYFSWYHNGVDIATSDVAHMPPILACASGTVSRAKWDPWGLGLHVRIRHANGYETIYGHMSRLDVAYGDEVSKGETIGIMGSTGRSTGPHTHFIVLYKGTAQNPLNYIN
jgi:murein DD-endopeptidase MepM/ murein hydrolase activator NlpD